MDDMKFLDPWQRRARVAAAVDAAAKMVELSNFEKKDHTPQEQRPESAGLGWNTGAPPCVGWWNASAGTDVTWFRYWNGTVWSKGCPESEYEIRPTKLEPSPENPAKIRWQAVRAPWDVDAKGFHPWQGGGKCPLPRGVMVNVLSTVGNTHTGQSHTFNWPYVAGYRVLS